MGLGLGVRSGFEVEHGAWHVAQCVQRAAAQPVGVRAEEADLLRVRVRIRVGGRVRVGVRAGEADRVPLVGAAHGMVLVRVRVKG